MKKKFILSLSLIFLLTFLVLPNSLVFAEREDDEEDEYDEEYDFEEEKEEDEYEEPVEESIEEPAPAEQPTPVTTPTTIQEIQTVNTLVTKTVIPPLKIKDDNQNGIVDSIEQFYQK